MIFVFILTVVTCAFNQILALTPRERKEFLDLHNHFRRSVYPSASDMQELEYNENIEKSVDDYLEHCKFEHRKLDGYGENGRLASDSNITNTVMSWFQERIFFNISAEGESRCSKLNSKYQYLDDLQCGHYKMMVKSTLKSLGCGYKFCKNIQGNGISYTDSYITFCFYNSGQKDQPYELGKPCSECSMSYQFCRDDLCVPKSRYDKNTRTCKLKCKNCGDFFDPKNSCLCDCPDGTEGNSCRGAPTVVDESCSPCQSQGLSCNFGIEDKKSTKCSCICPPQYIGEYCQIRKDQFDSSFYHVIDGTEWRHEMIIPVNIVEFQKSFHLFQSATVRLLNEFCVRNLNTYSECTEIKTNQIVPDNVSLIPGFPHLLENGSLAIRIFINFNPIIDGVKQEKFITTTLLREILTTDSEDVKKIIENVKKVFPSDNEVFKQSPIYEDVYNIPNSDSFATKAGDSTLDYTPSLKKVITESSEILIPITDSRYTTKNPIHTTDFKTSHVQDSTYRYTKNTHSIPKLNETTIIKITSENAITTPTSTEIKPTNKDKTNTVEWATTFQPVTNSSNSSTNYEDSTASLNTTSIPITTTKCAKINENKLNGFMLLFMLYICADL